MLGIFWRNYCINAEERLINDVFWCVASLLIMKPVLLKQWRQYSLNFSANLVVAFSKKLASRPLRISLLCSSYMTRFCSKSLLRFCTAFLQDEWSRAMVSQLFCIMLTFCNLNYILPDTFFPSASSSDINYLWIQSWWLHRNRCYCSRDYAGRLTGFEDIH